MQRNELESRAYMKPECEITKVQIEQFVCTSVVPQVPGSTEEEWENEEEINGGEIEI